MNIEIIFKRLGLSKHAYKVYELLQKHSSLRAHDVMKISGIHTPAVYAALSDLLENHFITFTLKGKRKFYETTDAENIVNKFSKVTHSLGKEINLEQPFRQSEIRILKGQNGIRDAFNDVVTHTRRGGTFYRYTSEKDLASVNTYLSEDYRKKRDAKKLERLVISNPESGKQKKSRLERFIRFIPEDQGLFDQNIIQIIYGERVMFIDLDKEIAMIIENNRMANFQATIFKQLYRTLPRE